PRPTSSIPRSGPYPTLHSFPTRRSSDLKARQVMVRLSSDHNHWKLTIEDDGRGFDFTGRLSQVQLDEVRKGPVVIKERVRLIDGELTIESNPGRGSRLEITVPQEQEAAHG